MKQGLLPLFCLASLACMAQRHPVPRVPPEEAAWFKFSYELPEAGKRTIPSTLAAAIQLAMNDFLPWDTKPPRKADPVEVCLHQRQSYDVQVVPATAEGVVLVRILLSPGACIQNGPLLDESATYAVDVKSGRILAVQRP